MKNTTLDSEPIFLHVQQPIAMNKSSQETYVSRVGRWYRTLKGYKWDLCASALVSALTEPLVMLKAGYLLCLGKTAYPNVNPLSLTVEQSRNAPMLFLKTY